MACSVKSRTWRKGDRGRLVENLDCVDESFDGARFEVRKAPANAAWYGPHCVQVNFIKDNGSVMSSGRNWLLCSSLVEAEASEKDQTK